MNSTHLIILKKIIVRTIDTKMTLTKNRSGHAVRDPSPFIALLSVVIIIISGFPNQYAIFSQLAFSLNREAPSHPLCAKYATCNNVSDVYFWSTRLTNQRAKNWKSLIFRISSWFVNQSDLCLAMPRTANKTVVWRSKKYIAVAL